MRPDPIRQSPGPGGFGVGVVAGTQHGHEYECRAYLTVRRIDDWNGVAGVIDESLLAGAVFLPQHHVQMARPVSILLAEPAVVGAVGVLFDELLPEELERDALVGCQFLVNGDEIGLCFASLWALGLAVDGRWRKQQPLQLRVVEGIRQGPTQVGGRSPFQVSLYGAPADPASVGDLPFAQMGFMVKPEDFFYLTHR